MISMNKAQKRMLTMILKYDGRTIYDIPRLAHFSERLKFVRLKKECEKLEGSNFGVLSYTAYDFSVGFIYPDWCTNAPRARVIAPNKVYDFLID